MSPGLLQSPALRIAAVVVLLLASFGFLISGSAWVERPVLWVPAGNWAAWLALVCLGALALMSCQSMPWLRWPARIVFLLAVAWYPTSVALMGNLNLSGGGPLAGPLWVWYTAALVLVPLVLLVVQFVVVIARRLG